MLRYLTTIVLMGAVCGAPAVQGQSAPSQESTEIRALIAVLEQPTWRAIGDIVEPVPGAEEARAKALASIRARGASAVPALIATLASPSRAGGDAATLLGAINDPRGIVPLIDALDGPHRESANAALSTMAHPTVADRVFAALTDARAMVREQSLLVLVARRDQRALPGLLGILKTGEAYRRWEAVGQLARLRPPDVGAHLRALLKDADMMVRSEAASRLGDVGTGDDVPDLINLLTDTQERVRWGAARALGLLRDRRALAPLQAALATETSEVNRQAMTAAIEAISKGRSY